MSGSLGCVHDAASLTIFLLRRIRADLGRVSQCMYFVDSQERRSMAVALEQEKEAKAEDSSESSVSAVPSLFSRASDCESQAVTARSFPRS